MTYTAICIPNPLRPALLVAAIRAGAGRLRRRVRRQPAAHPGRSRLAGDQRRRRARPGQPHARPANAHRDPPGDGHPAPGHGRGNRHRHAHRHAHLHGPPADRHRRPEPAGDRHRADDDRHRRSVAGHADRRRAPDRASAHHHPRAPGHRAAAARRAVPGGVLFGPQRVRRHLPDDVQRRWSAPSPAGWRTSASPPARRMAGRWSMRPTRAGASRSCRLPVDGICAGRSSPTPRGMNFAPVFSPDGTHDRVRLDAQRGHPDDLADGRGRRQTSARSRPSWGAIRRRPGGRMAASFCLPAISTARGICSSPC